MNLYAGDMAGGERGIACRPDRGAEVEANVPVVAAIGERLGCRKFNLLYGQLDDRWSITEQLETAVGTYSQAAATLRSIGGVLLIEALTKGVNGSYALSTPDEVMGLVNGPLAHCENAAACQLSGRIGHVQIADAPGRGAPGTGTLPLMAALAAIRSGGYQGRVGCEYVPAATRSTHCIG